MSPISDVYLSATWRNTTTFNSETGHIGLGFDLADGDVFRISIDENHARHLVKTILDQLPLPSVDVLREALTEIRALWMEIPER